MVEANKEILRVDSERLKGWFEELSEIGATTQGGVSRRALTEADLAGRNWFKVKIRSCGLELWEDSALNIGAKYSSLGASGPSVMTGSHLDSVENGGRLDGALGVLAGLECLTRLKELEVQLKRPIEAVSFTDEEGRFGGMMGSQALCGKLSAGYVERAKDVDGVALSDVLRSIGVNPEGLYTAKRSSDSIHRFLELHIEQGPVLGKEEINIGVVESIVGLFNWRVRYVGQANHSGTTPMHMRADAFKGLVCFASAVDEILKNHGTPSSVSNIGKVELLPGAANVVPGQAEFTFEVRDSCGATLNLLADKLADAATDIARRLSLQIQIDSMAEIAPEQCDGDTISIVESAAADLGVTSKRMVSGAAHDTQNMIALAPSAMVFVPSRGGFSHCPEEATSWKDICNGANVLLNAIYRLAC